MKLFLDENLPHRLRLALSGHDVFTAQFMGWAGIKNGQLLGLVEADAFEVFVTADRKMKDQQNFTRTLKYLRRKRFISEFISMCVSHLHKCVYIASDGGRLCRSTGNSPKAGTCACARPPPCACAP